MGAWVVIVGLVRGGGGIEALSFSFEIESWGEDSVAPSRGMGTSDSWGKASGF